MVYQYCCQMLALNNVKNGTEKRTFTGSTSRCFCLIKEPTMLVKLCFYIVFIMENLKRNTIKNAYIPSVFIVLLNN